MHLIVEITVVESHDAGLGGHGLATEETRRFIKACRAPPGPCQRLHLRPERRGRNRHQPRIRADMVVHQDRQGGSLLHQTPSRLV